MSTPPTLVCVDPGKEGGYALRSLVSDAGVVIRNFTRAGDVAGQLRGLKSFKCDIRAVVENVHASPVMSPSSSFSFGRNLGQWEGVLASLEIEPLYISPQQWQAPWADRLEGLEKDARKRELAVIAREIFPGVKLTLKTCDAALMTEFVVRYYKQHGKMPGKPASHE